MGRNYRLVVFDWDGTLLDSAGAIVACMRAAAIDLDLPPPDEKTARHVIGLGLHDALSQAMPDVPSSEYQRVAERYRHHYLAQDHQLSLFAGARELVEELSQTGCLLGVATGKSRLGLNRALETSGLKRYFHATRCADECSSKPAPDMLREIMDQLDTVPDQTLMIGDTIHDLQMAKNAGVGALAVGYGAHSREVLQAERPLGLFDEFAQLTEWLRRHG
ncbi:MAG: HAD-IA family hydrolase [Rhodocyclaceae bacterium]|nr:HAD-IA family hydrolase [Rhodocyclaceae bacterium]MBX3677642.1 HAD-IA family hydrolase [Rhodocyclaceae bacterium]MCB1892036.1 HAD-IA family hydrolase [Rhodocyclaceae bacterium]MCP5296560.1 HAD-IA family hydrolase [Zoogloeaceae bacterium]MCW5595089.1 HAD-IA family hydrolase [Rhodocyclaceae bacterium]